MKLRLGSLLAGIALLVVYIRIGTELGYHASYGPAIAYDRTATHGFNYIGDSEFRFWFAHLVLALPGVLLIGWAFEPRISRALRRLAARIDGASAREWRIAAIAMFAILAVAYVLGHEILLCGRPITDDENGVAFGARILAAGHLHVPILQPAGAYPDLFTFQRDGTVTSMDFIGGIGFAAIGIATHLGNALYGIASAATGVTVACAAKRWLGPRGAVLAAALWIASPMIAALSCTSHAHVASRMFVALVFLFAARLDRQRDAVLLGLCAGLAFLCRPLEAVFLLAPLGAYLVWRSPRRGLGMLAGLVVPALVFAWTNLEITGVWWQQARFAPSGVIGGNPSLRFGMGERLGFNLGFNSLVLAVFFLGIPAIAAIAAGLDRRKPIQLVLGACVLGQLALCLLHDNTGVHSVGPIHLSETTVPLVLLAAAGLLRGFAWLRARGLPQAPAGALLASYLVLGCGLFMITNFASLHDTTAKQRQADELLESLDIHHAVVIAEPYAPWAFQTGTTGTWVMQYPHPDWRLDDDVIFAKPDANLAALRARFPDRKLYVLHYSATEPTFLVSEAPGS